MENYHKHTSCQNIFTPDSTVFYEDYAKRAKELNQHIVCSVEHGFQGKYHEAREVANKYGLKFVFGTEAYWVKDRHEKDRTNGHIIVLAKSEEGRECINDMLSTANEDGYFYKPRVDEELLLKLPPKDVLITSACVAFWKNEDVDDFVTKLYDRFGSNFMLEVQPHNTPSQKEINTHIKALSARHGIKMIAGLDSHFIYPEQAEEREALLDANGIHYEDESGWNLDYPDEDTVKARFAEQGILSAEEAQEAMDNTEVTLEFEDYKTQVFETNRKLPTIYPDKTQDEKNHIYGRLVTKKFKDYMRNIPPEQYQTYFDGVKSEVATYKETGMVDYPLLDYAIVNRGIEKGGILTHTGRGSAVSFLTNTLCGFSSVDRFKSPIKLYPERFMSKTRIIETNSLPDIDMNVASQEPFEEAQREILGDDHAYPMIAYGTLKKKAAFKLYARAKKLDFDTANSVSDQIGSYEEALKFADDEDKKTMSVFDFVDPQYHDLVKKSESYWGIIKSKAKAPCAYLLYQGSIRREIGLIRCKSETSKKDCMTTVTDGAVAENYKFLKNDWLIVDTVYLTDAIFKRIGMKALSVDELNAVVKDNQKIWDIYAKGLTIGINQCEKESTTKRLMRYKPENVSELTAFVAAIRPGFKSMYSKFESRESFEYGIPCLDETIQTKEFPYSYILYQETLMAVLHLAGFPMDQCYGIIKAIAKKHPEKVRPLKAQFLDGFKAKIQGECPEGKTPDEVAADVWQIIEDSTRYSFNSSHAYQMALDSLYNAYQKAYYPYEFYEVLLQRFSEKGKKDKVSALKQEMKTGFGIEEGPIKWGTDNRSFKADKDNHCIYPSLLSIKGLSQGCANDLYALSRRQYKNFYDLWKTLSGTRSLNSAKIDTLIRIGYFRCFAGTNKLLSFIAATDELYGRVQFPKDAQTQYKSIIEKHSETTDKLKTYKNFDFDAALEEVWDTLPDEDSSAKDKIDAEIKYLGYAKTTMPSLPSSYCYVEAVDGKFSNKMLTLYQLSDGYQYKIKVKKTQLDKDLIEVGDIINSKEESSEGKWSKDASGNWVQDQENREMILKKYVHVR